MTSPNAPYHALVDSDAFVGLFYDADAHHETAHRLFQEAADHNLSLVTTSFVIAETATVLSNRKGREAAVQFLDFSTKLPLIHITEELQSAALDLFRQQANKGVSVVDCSNVVIAERFGISRIFSFDQFYQKKFNLQIAA